MCTRGIRYRITTNRVARRYRTRVHPWLLRRLGRGRARVRRIRTRSCRRSFNNRTLMRNSESHARRAIRTRRITRNHTHTMRVYNLNSNLTMCGWANMCTLRRR